MAYIGGLIGGYVYLPGLDTVRARSKNDAYIAAYNLAKSTTSVKENPAYIKAGNGLLAYPNPTQGPLTLLGEAVSRQGQLFTISGQLVRSFALDQNAFQQQLDLSGLEKGIYFLMVVGEKEKQVLKVVKQ